MYKQSPKSPILKALVGEQGNLPQHLQAKILASPESPVKLKDACYHKVKAQYDVFPSAYASGAIAKCRKNKGKKKK